MVQASERVTIETDVVFGRGGGRDLRCDVYTPPAHTSPNSAGGAPGVLLVHGGGWREGDRKQLSGYGILLGREGFVCVCCEYRLSAEAQWPAQIHDVNAALRWMHANADRLGIDARGGDDRAQTRDQTHVHGLRETRPPFCGGADRARTRLRAVRLVDFSLSESTLPSLGSLEGVLVQRFLTPMTDPFSDVSATSG